MTTAELNQAASDLIEKLVQLRMNRGLSQTQLAARMGTHRCNISLIDTSTARPIPASGGGSGAGAPDYGDADLQKHAIQGRLDVARGIAERAAKSGDKRRAERWKGIVDELLDRLLEVRGR